MIIFRILTTVFRPFAWIFWQLRHTGVENVPKKGAVILTSNHINLFDPFFHAFTLWRPFNTMAKAELFDRRLFAWAINVVGGFPVKRGNADTESVKHAVKTLKSGKVVLIFPEGTRLPERGVTGTFKPGAALLCKLTDAVVVPSAIVAGNGARLFSHVHITYGKPVTKEELGITRGTSAELHAAADKLRELTMELIAETEAKLAERKLR